MTVDSAAPSEARRGPLDGLFVLDLSRVLSGPFATMHLAMYGARVVKIEHPRGGDDTRAFGPPFLGGEAAYYLSVNAGKESLALDLKDPRAKEIVRRLAARADVLVENFRPGTLARLGLPHDELLAANPRLVYCAISGYGLEGDPRYCTLPGYDIVIQGVGGLPSLTGPPEGPPYRVGVAIADLVSGLYATIGILLALHARSRTGRGQLVDVSMQDGMIGLLTYQAGNYFATGRPPARHGNGHPNICPYDAFEAEDGYFNLAVGNDALFRAFAGIVGRPELATDARFATNAARVENRQALYAEIKPLLRARPVAAWLGELEAAGIPCGPILGLDQALGHPQVKARGMVVELDHPTAGKVRVTGPPVRLADTPGAVDRAPPLLGADGERLLAELAGLSADEIATLVRERVTLPPRP